MNADFWHEIWQSNIINFHLNDVNPALVKFLPELELQAGARLFLPLCGKTLDIKWLLDQGYKVAGAELSELAIAQLFSELNLEPAISKVGKCRLFQADGLDIFVGDIFDLTAEQLGKIDAVYDRAALVALPHDTRQDYAPLLSRLTNNAPQLLIVFEYAQALADGPPFSLQEVEVRQLYGERYNLRMLSRRDLPALLKGEHPWQQVVWTLAQALLDARPKTAE